MLLIWHYHKRVISIGILLFLIGCGGSSSDASTNSNWYKPDINTSWQWQLQGDINTSYDVKIYDIDLFDSF